MSALHCLFVWGDSCATRAASVRISSRASTAVTPGFVRPTTCKSRVCRSNSPPGRAKGIQASTRPQNSKSAGATPTTTYVSPLRRMVLPTMSASPPNWVCQISWLRMVTLSPPGRNSAAEKKRPNSGRKRKVSKKFGVMRAPDTRMGGSPDKATLALRTAASCSKHVF